MRKTGGESRFDFLKALSVSNLNALAVTVWLVEDTKHKCAYFLNCFEQKYLPPFFLNTSEKKLSYIYVNYGVERKVRLS